MQYGRSSSDSLVNSPMGLGEHIHANYRTKQRKMITPDIIVMGTLSFPVQTNKEGGLTKELFICLKKYRPHWIQQV